MFVFNVNEMMTTKQKKNIYIYKYKRKENKYK